MLPDWLAPLITSIGIVTGISISVWQQRQASLREASQLRRRGMASRATLPGALTDICQYSEDCAEVLRSVMDQERESPIATNGGEARSCPEIPSDAIRIVRDCIEHADEDHIPSLAECIRRLQAQHSRLVSFLNKQPITMYRASSRMADTILLHAYASRLFAYARIAKLYESDRTYAQYVSASAKACGIYEHDYPEVFKILGRLSAW